MLFSANLSLFDNAYLFILDYGVPSHLSGTAFLAHAIILKLSHPFASMSELYSIIADHHNRSPRAVASCIIYAIKHSDSICSRLRLLRNDLFPGRVISLLAPIFKSSLLSSQSAAALDPI